MKGQTRPCAGGKWPNIRFALLISMLGLSGGCFSGSYEYAKRVHDLNEMPDGAYLSHDDYLRFLHEEAAWDNVR
jgi:hypothetical protein